MNGRNVGGADGQVVSERVWAQAPNVGEKTEKGVVGDDEEERGKGTSLLDTASDVDPRGRGSPKKGGHSDVAKGARDKAAKPGRVAGFGENMLDPIVVDGVKGFRGVQQQQKTVLPPSEGLVKEGVDIHSMLAAVDASEEALLAWVNVVRMARAIVAARMRLSVLVTLRGRVSATRPVSFLGRRKIRPSLNPSGGRWLLRRASRAPYSTGAASSGAARQAAKEIPSGPAAVFLEWSRE